MRYSSQALMLLAASLAAALVIYAPFYIKLRKKGNVLLPRQTANYLFVAYSFFILAAVFIPQSAVSVQARSVNWVPLDALRTAFYDGISVAMTQYILNILLFLPLGLLLPVVFPRRAGTMLRVLGVVATAAILIEAVQYLIGRVADIDDVINNTLGGLSGFGLYVLLDCALGRRPGWRRMCMAPVCSKALRTWAVILILVPWLPAATAWGMNTFSEFAPLPEGLLLPEDTTVTADLTDLPSNAMVYVTSATVSIDDTVSSLKTTFSVQGDYHTDELGVSVSDSDAQCSIRVNNDGTWRIQYYGNREHCLELADSAVMPSDEDCAAKALAFFSTAGMDVTHLQAESIADVIQTDSSTAAGSAASSVVIGRQVTLVDTTDDASVRVTGNLTVEVGLDGSILSGSDDRLCHIAMKEVALCTVDQAIKTAQSQGNEDPAIASVQITSVTLDYEVEPLKHHLQPVWKLMGMATLTDGQTQPFQTTVSAME